MKFLPLVYRNLLRRKFRTVFTLGCIFISFVLFSFLMIVRTAFSMGIDFAGADRLWMMHKVSIIVPVPASYLNDLMSTPNVALATYSTWFGGSYQGKPGQFAVFATDVPTYLKLYPEFDVAPDQLKALESDRMGAIVGLDTATKYGWKIGDKVPLMGDIYPAKGGGPWTFNIDGIYDSKKTAVDKTQFLFRYDYFDENRISQTRGQVNWFVIKVTDPSQSASVASAIDSHFANSPAETKTGPESAMIADFAKQTGNIGAMITAVLTVVLFVILLVVANTMAQSVRERTAELAVLKTLGFGDVRILLLVLGESLLIAVLGGGSALALMRIIVGRGSMNIPMLPVFAFTTPAVVLGASLVLLLGLVAGVLPALAAMRLKITDALRRN
jgi:putative ABC transport system permease protein